MLPHADLSTFSSSLGKKAVLFDLDGTLLDTIDDLWQSTNYALHAHGFALRSRQEVLGFVGNGVAKLIERAVPEGTNTHDVQQTLATFRQHYMAHSMDNTRPYDGVMPLLQALQAVGCCTAVVSNKMDEAVGELCCHFFSPLIHVATGVSQHCRPKPAPDMVLRALQELGIGAEDALYVGDSDVDILTARNSGLPCISVLWGFRDRDFLIQHGAETLISAPSELLLF